MLLRKMLMFLTLFPLFGFCIDNFFYVSIPKCGTSYLGVILMELTKKGFGIYLDYPVDNNLIELSNSQNAFPFKHLLTQKDKEFLISNDYKIIFLYRDPRDQLISSIFWLEKQIPNHDISRIPTIIDKITKILTADKNNLYEFTTQTIMNAISHDDWFVNFYRQIEDFPPHLLLKIKFEDLIGSKGGGNDTKQEETLIRIAEFLNICIKPNDLIKIANQWWGLSGTFRCGKIGAWKKFFTEEHIKLYKQNYEDILFELEYEKDFNWTN